MANNDINFGVQLGSMIAMVQKKNKRSVAAANTVGKNEELKRASKYQHDDLEISEIEDKYSFDDAGDSIGNDDTAGKK